MASKEKLKKDIAPKELADLSAESLTEKLDTAKKNLFNLRFKKAAGDLSNLSSLPAAKRDVARIKTEINKRKKNI